MNPVVNSISGRLSLRTPQRDSLEILARLTEILPLEKDADVGSALDVVQSEFPSVTDFERDFPSLCFNLATGVGKTRLMGAFIAYLYKEQGIRHFFVLAPNLTIYNKLIADFTPNTPKYVFQGIEYFATNPPEIITGDNYESGRGVRNEGAIQSRFFDVGDVHINIFNISKINSEVRGDKAPRIKRLSEYIGESYFEYLSKLDDLVLLMDESHRYRASAGIKAINELKPILGLELTATPQVEKGSKAEPFKNVIFSYPLSKALTDPEGYVKEPAVATRENFDVKKYDKDGLEKLKLEDGVRVHENTKLELEVYARETKRPLVKPFMLVVAEDTKHADALVKLIESDGFFEGRYKGKVITVHSNLKGEEKDETVQQLISVEDPANPTEIVVHVNMLKEGWDVTNLYTIVPLRAANSKTLVEQSIGRGLRLPYGKRTRVPAVDRLTIVSHDHFQEIIDEANRPESIIRSGIVIGRDIPDTKSKVVVVESLLHQRIIGAPNPETGTPYQSVFQDEDEKRVALAVMEEVKHYERLKGTIELRKPAIQQEIARKVTERLAPVQPGLPTTARKVNVADVVSKTAELMIDMSIDIPKIIVVPKGEVKSGFQEFNLDTHGVSLQPIARDILIQHLAQFARYKIGMSGPTVTEEKPEDYLVRGLIDCDDISYDDHADLIYKLAGQMVSHLRSYLSNDEDVQNVLQYHQQDLVKLIHAQMVDHYSEDPATIYETKIVKGFRTMSPGNHKVADGEPVRNFRTPVEEKLFIRGMLFGGFKKCLYEAQRFDSDSERRFAVILENDGDVLKWFRPVSRDVQIDYRFNREDSAYEPDFIVEGKSTKYMCEVKRASEISDPEVQAKAEAARIWCAQATKEAGGKPWVYLLIPHDDIAENMSLAGLRSRTT